MNVLHLAYRDTSGVPGRWVKAHRAAGLNARLLVEFPHPFAYGHAQKIIRWSTDGPDLIELDLEWADAIMAYDHPVYLAAALATGKPVMYRTLGQSAREHAPRLRELLQSPRVVRATAGLPDNAETLGLPLVGAPYPLLERATSSGMVLSHSPSNRSFKGTDAIVRAAEGTGWTVDIVDKQPNWRVMKRKRKAALVVDSFNGLGYGVNAIEAMALGLPAVAGATREIRLAWEAAGSPVVLPATQDELRSVLFRLAHDAEMRSWLGQRGREYVAGFHCPETRAAEDTLALKTRELVAA